MWLFAIFQNTFAICNFSKKQQRVHSTKPRTFSKNSKALMGMCTWVLLPEMRWKPVVLTQALELVIFPLIGSLKENWQLSFPKTFGTTKVHVLRLRVSHKATWKNVVLCPFSRVPEQETDSNCIVKPITTSLYSFLPQKTNIVWFSKSLIYYFQQPGWELIGRKCKSCPNRSLHKSYCL